MSGLIAMTIVSAAVVAMLQVLDAAAREKESRTQNKKDDEA